MTAGLKWVANFRALTHPRGFGDKHKLWRSFAMLEEVWTNPRVKKVFSKKLTWVGFKIKYLSLAKWPWVYWSYAFLNKPYTLLLLFYNLCFLNKLDAPNANSLSYDCLTPSLFKNKSLKKLKPKRFVFRYWQGFLTSPLLQGEPTNKVFRAKSVKAPLSFFKK